jgi:hypothetical protein
VWLTRRCAGGDPWGASQRRVVDYNTVTGTTQTTRKGTGEVYGKAAAEFIAAGNDLPKIQTQGDRDEKYSLF